MLAYRIIKELSNIWRHLDITVEEGIKLLTTLCTMQVKVNDLVYYNEIPKPNKNIQELFAAANILLPKNYIYLIRKEITLNRNWQIPWSIFIVINFETMNQIKSYFKNIFIEIKNYLFFKNLTTIATIQIG